MVRVVRRPLSATPGLLLSTPSGAVAAARFLAGDPRTIPTRHGRRSWRGRDRLHLEVRGLGRPSIDRLARDLQSRVEGLDGVRCARLNAAVGRLVVAVDEDAAGFEDLDAAITRVVAEVERDHGVDREAFPVDREHPGDRESLQRHAAALGADALAVGLTVVGRLTELAPLPIEALSLVSLVDSVPRVRGLAERRFGVPATDLGLSLANALVSGLTQGPFGLVVDAAHRWGQVNEIRARQRVWARREPQLCAAPEQFEVTSLEGDGRPRHLPSGPVERAADRLSLSSVGIAAAVLAASSSPRRAARLLLAGSPRAARLGREAFAAQLGGVLAGRGIVPLDGQALRRLDRVDTVVVEAGLLTARRWVPARSRPSATWIPRSWSGRPSVCSTQSVPSGSDGPAPGGSGGRTGWTPRPRAGRPRGSADWEPAGRSSSRWRTGTGSSGWSRWPLN